MLYISRYITDYSYGVVDSDDGVETIVTREELAAVCITFRLKVKGVEVKHGNMGWYVDAVEPYQDRNTYNKRQIKALTLLGVDLKIYDQEIVAISADSSVAKSDVVLRPSEFAKKLSCFVKLNKSASCSLTIVLDDRIEVVGETFRVGLNGVRFDLREVSNEMTAKSVYKDVVVEYPVPIDMWEHYIIDNDSRSGFWKAIAAIDESDEAVIKDIICNVDMHELCVQIEELYLEDWLRLVSDDKPVAFYSSMSPVSCLNLFTDFMETPWDFTQEVTDYAVVRKRMPDLSNMLKITSTTNTVAVRRLNTYTQFCDVSDEVKKIAIALYNKSCKSIVAYCKMNDLSLPG